MARSPSTLFGMTFIFAAAWAVSRVKTATRQSKATPGQAMNDKAEELHRVEEAMLAALQKDFGPSLPLVYGWTLAETERSHGRRRQGIDADGWAVWPTFKAHFNQGKVDIVEGLNH